MTTTPRGRTAVVAFGLGLTLLAGVFWLAFRNADRLLIDADWRLHTYFVVAETRALLSALLDGQNGEQGYRLTGDPTFLIPFHRARKEVPERIASLLRLTRDPDQQRRLAALAPVAMAVLQGFDLGIRGTQQVHGPAGRPDLSAPPASVAAQLVVRRGMDDLRNRIAAIEAEETHRLDSRDASMLATLHRTEISLYAGLAASAALLVAAFLALRREVGQRRFAEESALRLNARLALANQELEAFCYSVSHDLRAPLRAVDGFSQALLEDASERLLPTDRALLDRVRAAAQRMAGLIDDLLRLSRISLMAIEPHGLDLSEIAGSIVADLRQRDPQRRAVVEIETGMDGVGDERLLRVALENLLGNAWKFTRHRDEAHIHFGVAEHGTEGKVYCVRDDGAGFDMAYAGKLFGAFQRLHSEREFEGTGIGLATVARVIHLHGGRIWAEATVGQGAALYFTLAVAEAAARKESTV